ncbi:12088_t:CDS:1 [Acaulospora colombiana]|uniref:12088_t:CDS:1 n=1 Tax=Acaulospora colombiana TaxID=27376 RepID=A0ACA9LXT7_9GLOM|nr:12088_t:CDS:1 [Acaulospora colombiana]
MPEFRNLHNTSTLIISAASYGSSSNCLFASPIMIFPDEVVSEEPANIENEEVSDSGCFIQSPMDRKMERYRKLRAMHERAGRLPKSTVPENDSRNSSQSSTSSDRSNSEN